jgi:nitrite reductase/ring-hydroxylating ferredoxin subunit
MRFVVARLSEFPDNSRKIVRVGGREIGVFRVGERFFAVRNRCPHQGGPLCVGRVYPLVVADAPGEIRLEETMLVSCPWHGWQYDMVTGKSYVPGDPNVRSFDVRVEHGGEIVDCDAKPEYVAETFAVSIDEDYVVLDA